MNIKVEWYTDDCKIIYLDFDVIWTWEDYIVSYCTLCQYAASVEHRVDVLAEMKRASMLPKRSMVAYRFTAEKLPPNVRSIAFVGANVWVKSMLKGLRRFNPELGDKIFFTDTRLQALQLLSQADVNASGVATRGYDSDGKF